MARYDEKKLLSGVLVAASPVTSDILNLENYGGGVGLQLQAASITSGNGVFTFFGTIDGVNYVALNVLITNVTNTNGQTVTRVASVTLSSNTTSLVFLEKHIVAGLKAIKVVVTITTDGAYSCSAIAKE